MSKLDYWKIRLKQYQLSGNINIHWTCFIKSWLNPKSFITDKFLWIDQIDWIMHTILFESNTFNYTYIQITWPVWKNNLMFKKIWKFLKKSIKNSLILISFHFDKYSFLIISLWAILINKVLVLKMSVFAEKHFWGEQLTLF